jgi:Mn-dependent DtxR family transcriptional regulator
MVMWSNFMRFVDEEGTRELQHRLRVSPKSSRTWLTRMEKWWGYIVVESNGTVRPTPGERKAIEIWRTLENLIESRWRERFGDDTID